jgi:transcriptional regulator with XRE-family HTH domain
MSLANPIFGPLLRRKRLALGLGLVEFAKACKLDPTLLSRIESGERLPPELPGLMVIALQLKIPLNSEEFAEMLAAVDHDRNPALHKMALEMRGGKQWNPFAQMEKHEVVCDGLGELVSKATEQAIRVGANAIAVYSPSGRSMTFRIRGKKQTMKRKNKQKQ